MGRIAAIDFVHHLHVPKATLHSLGFSRVKKLDRTGAKHMDPTAARIAATETENLSETTVRKVLHQHGMNHRICRKKPIIGEINQEKRKVWANGVEGMDWRRVIFTDEAAFYVGDDFGRIGCWREPGMEHEPKDTVNKKRKRGAVHVWGAVMYGRKFPLHFFELAKEKPTKGVRRKGETITATKYCEQILWGPMQEAVNKAKAAGVDPLVVEDGAPVPFMGVAKRIPTMLDITNLTHYL